MWAYMQLYWAGHACLVLVGRGDHNVGSAVVYVLHMHSTAEHVPHHHIITITEIMVHII